MRLIDAEKLSEDIMKTLDSAKEKGHTDIYNIICDIFVPMVIGQPTIEAESVKHGHWVHPSQNCDYRSRDIFSDCSVCGDVQIDNTNYCPNCGAKMDAEGEAEE